MGNLKGNNNGNMTTSLNVTLVFYCLHCCLWTSVYTRESRRNMIKVISRAIWAYFRPWEHTCIFLKRGTKREVLSKKGNLSRKTDNLLLHPPKVVFLSFLTFLRLIKNMAMHFVASNIHLLVSLNQHFSCQETFSAVSQLYTVWNDRSRKVFHGIISLAHETTINKKRFDNAIFDFTGTFEKHMLKVVFKSRKNTYRYNSQRLYWFQTSPQTRLNS